jgi:probable blue pigment (indigoidine) exporter
VVEGPPSSMTGTNVAGFAYLAIVNTALGYALWLRGVERLPATNMAFLALMSPVVATITGWIVLAEGLTGLQMLGAAVALSALVAGQLPARRQEGARQRGHRRMATAMT